MAGERRGFCVTEASSPQNRISPASEFPSCEGGVCQLWVCVCVCVCVCSFFSHKRGVHKSAQHQYARNTKTGGKGYILRLLFTQPGHQSRRFTRVREREREREGRVQQLDGNNPR
ncbi:hypothetical protein LX32DRAFT_327310 [Colletotrichum zoysiae]|uniref:Uncharacterized protein n=1 Tax=Colletotrichum zoysiae TaxID=1216348 RepID=A0AAD9H157_9PEZI|nr:hypothetical protein LX32DRAFT_327310 [Colletotrichum zoysiae]